MCSDVTYGFTVGFTGMLMIVLLILMDRKKARHPVFILNFLCLFLVCIRDIVLLINTLSIYGYGFGEDFFYALAQFKSSATWKPKVLTINIIGLIFYPCIFATLILQVRAVFAAEPQIQLIITISLTIFALFIEGFWLAFQSLYMHQIDTQNIVYLKPYLYETVQWSFISFISVCCLLFVYKLFITIRRRQQMGFHSFGPIHVLFIMFCQCLVLPVIFYIVEFTSKTIIQNFLGLGQTFLVASLPLSALWASHESKEAPKQRPVLAKSSSAAATALSFSFRFREKFKFSKTSKDSNSSHSDLEKASDLTEGKDMTDVSIEECQHSSIPPSS